MAISLVGEACENFQTAAKVAEFLLNKLIKHPLPADTILNVNVPDVPWDKLTGFDSTRLGRRHKSEPVVKLKDPRGRPIYWVGPVGKEEDAGPGTDFNAVRNNAVSVTPLQIDLTQYSAMDTVANWLKEQ